MNKAEIGNRLRQLRGDRSREEMACAIGVTAQAIFNYETGERVPTDEIKIRIAEYFQKTVQEIFFD